MNPCKHNPPPGSILCPQCLVERWDHQMLNMTVARGLHIDDLRELAVVGGGEKLARELSEAYAVPCEVW